MLFILRTFYIDNRNSLVTSEMREILKTKGIYLTLEAVRKKLNKLVGMGLLEKVKSFIVMYSPNRKSRQIKEIVAKYLIIR